MAATTKKKKGYGLYMKSIICRKVPLPFKSIGNNINQNLQKLLENKYEGKCIKEGFVKPRSIRINTYSSGIIKGTEVMFDVSFECLICRPVEGYTFSCVAKNITKAGIRAELDKESPVIVFIARDHQYENKYFASVSEGDIIRVKIIGIRYELNDTYISVIGDLVKPKKKYVMATKK